MEPAGERSTPGDGSESGDLQATRRTFSPRAGVAAVTVVAVALALVALSGAGGGTVPTGHFNASNDTGPPTLGNLTRVDDTTMTLEVVDDTDVDESSIDATDFVLTFGTLASANATADGSNATVTLDLAAPVASNRVSVGVASGATILDAAGNELRVSQTDRQTVTGMDGVAPSIDHFEATNASGSAINVTVGFTEPAKSFVVELSGPDTLTLDESDFADTDGYAEYVASVRPAVGGTYRVDVVSVTDFHGNGGPADAEANVTVDVDGPDAVAGIDFAASNGTVFTFDASRSTDASPIRNYTWAFGDGTRAEGVRVTHAFEPGNYTVRLNATDAHGNRGTDEFVLNLTDANASVDVAALLADDEVSITTAGAAGNASAMVDVPEVAAGEAVSLVPTGERPLASGGAVAVESMTVTLSTNRSYRLGVQVDGPGAAGGLVTNGSVLAGVTVVHDVPDAAVRNVSFTLAVERSLLDTSDGIRMYRHGDGGWNGLETRTLNGTNATARYRANASGLSRFAVVAEPASEPTETATATATATPTATEPTATVTVVDASLNATAVEPNGTVAISATVRNRGDEPARFTAGLAVDGAVVETRSVSVPAGETRTASFSYSSGEPGSYAVAVNGTTAGTLDVGGEASAGLLGVFGFLPLGLLQTVLTYVGGLLVAVFLVLKALALYLGY